MNGSTKSALASAARRAAAVALAATVLSGCASGEETPSASETSATTGSVPSASGTQTSSPSVTSSEPTEDDAVEVRVAVRNGEVRPRLRRVKVPRGETVRLTVRADVREEVHVHGYDVSKNVRPGRAATLEFVADEQGVFEVELEHSGLQLLQLQVQ